MNRKDIITMKFIHQDAILGVLTLNRERVITCSCYLLTEEQCSLQFVVFSTKPASHECVTKNFNLS